MENHNDGMKSCGTDSTRRGEYVEACDKFSLENDDNTENYAAATTGCDEDIKNYTTFSKGQDSGEDCTREKVTGKKRSAEKPRGGVKLDLKRIVGMAMFAALAYAVTFVFRIPVQFLTFDAKDAVLTIAAFIYGPTSAIIMSVIPALIEFISISGTGFWGFLMNFASSACFSFVASLIYKHRRSLRGAIMGLFTSVVVTTAFMMLMNILITPIYMKVPSDVVLGLLPTLLLPFNFAKALMNTAIAMLIYKPVSVAMKRVGFISGKADDKFGKQTAIMLITGAVTLAVAIILFVILKYYPHQA